MVAITDYASIAGYLLLEYNSHPYHIYFKRYQSYYDANIGYIFNITKYLDIFLDIFSKYLCDSWF